MPAPNSQQAPTPKSITFRDFGGMNVQSPRQAIGDDEFYWLENVIPIGAGKAQVVPQVSAALKTIAGQSVVRAKAVNISGTDYIVAIMASGHAYLILSFNPFTATQITTALGAVFSSSTQIAQWKNSGVLFIDPTGYYDYNLTVPGALSAISSAVNGITLTALGTGYTTQPSLVFSGGTTGTNATGIADLSPQGVAIVAGGAGYALGDLFKVVGGAGPVTFTGRVTGVGGGGVVTTATNFAPAADYTTLPGAASATTTVTGGGAGLTVTLNNVQLINPKILTSGSGYIGAPAVTVTGGGGAGATATATISPAFAGTSIETYAGRVWIGNVRAVAFTDVDSYNSFGGAGSSFTITDQTLHASITKLFAANGFLYIFGDDSIDILSNVQVAAGLTSFSRANVEASIGTIFTDTVFAWHRSVLFSTYSGFYALTGATPQKLSEKLDGLFDNGSGTSGIDFTKTISGGQVTVGNMLCAAFMFYINDTFTPIGGNRAVIALLYKNKWFLAAQGTQLVFAVPLNSASQTLMYGLSYTGADTVLTQLFFGNNNAQAVLMMSKLWDDGDPLTDKQIMRAGLGINWNGVATSGNTIGVTTDNEYGTRPASNIIPGTLPTGVRSYTFNAGAAQSGGGKYVGMTVQASVNRIVFALMALEYSQGARWSTP